MSFKAGFVVLASLAFFTPATAAPVSPAEHMAIAPDVAINAKGEIAILWVDKAPEQRRQESGGTHDNHLAVTDLYVALSRDGGKTFDAPTKVNHDSGVVWGQQVSRPRIDSTKKGSWQVSYTANEIHPKLNKPALTFHHTRSLDGGKSFEAPQRIGTLTDNDMSAVIHGGFTSAAAFGAMAVAPDDSIHVLWIDTRFMKSEADAGALFTSVSRDDGATFQTEKQQLQGGVCPCCQLMAIADAQSNILIGSRKVTADNFRPSTFARLDAATDTMSERVDTGGAAWQIAGCPLKPTAIAVSGNAVFTAVYNGGEAKPGVLFSYSGDNGKTFTATPAHPDAQVSDAPSIATNGRYVLLAWHGKTTGARRVFYRMYDVTGKPAGDIIELAAAPENAQNPVVAVRRDGKFQIAYQQSNRIYTEVLPASPATKVVKN
ncbi:MAG: hypothetical protein JNM81_09930 [Rhodospirillaceae bacterium]|nr:hypothetical protein [Rhodospirillaceae bacterium]